jgi:hypothetical protein
MRKTTRINHKCRTTDGRTVTTPMALGQVWLYRGSRHVVERVFPRKVRLDCGKIFLTVDQGRFIQHAKLKLNP